MRRLLTTSGSPASGCMMFGEAPARLAVLVASLLSVGELLGLLDDFQQLFGLVAVACSRVPLQKGCQYRNPWSGPSAPDQGFRPFRALGGRHVW